MQRLVWISRYIALIALIGAVGGGSWWFAHRDALDRLADRGQADLSWAADRLKAQLFRYRELAVVLARHPDLIRAATEARPRSGDQDILREMADMTGADLVVLYGLDGRPLSASRATAPARLPEALPLSRALDGALGTTHAVTRAGGEDAHRVFDFAAPVFDAAGQVAGAVLVEAGVAGIEENWPGNAPPVFFSAPDGAVIVTDRSDLVLSNPLTGVGFPSFEASTLAGHELWQLDAGPYLPARALHLSRALPTIGMRADILVDTAGAERAALLQGALAAAIALVFVVVLEVILFGRRALSRRLEEEANANQWLEERVRERTLALSQTNESLSREVIERTEAEAALKRAQGELVQAGKLAALGKMSAGISHELNQPLMAIRSYAENAELFFERDRPAEARENLGRIAELARRMGRIIQNLRAFARQESGPVTDVDLAGVIASALETAQPKIDRNGVTLDWVAPPGPVLVRGGSVRLEQVIVNLVSNAADAMEESAARILTIRLEDTPEIVRLSVADTGPGIADPERLFEPFYSTKNIGAAEGMGLGLSIAYGFIQGVGGAIRGENRPEGGAVFTVELIRAKEAA